MKSNIIAKGNLKQPLSDFIEQEQISLTIIDSGKDTIAVKPSDDYLESTTLSLHPNGWIKCKTAHIIADELNISNRDVGKILNFLKIKVRECELGCF